MKGTKVIPIGLCVFAFMCGFNMLQAANILSQKRVNYTRSHSIVIINVEDYIIKEVPLSREVVHTAFRVIEVSRKLKKNPLSKDILSNLVQSAYAGELIVAELVHLEKMASSALSSKKTPIALQESGNTVRFAP